MTYRAAPVTQRDGSPLASSNCLLAAGATGLDYTTLGAETTTGKRMRELCGDQSGGTNSDEVDRAWHAGWDEDAVIRDGRPWSDVIADLDAGRLVMLQVWHKTTGGPCLSGSGAYGHGLAVAPERNGSRWLVSDPWCSPPKWVWWEESKLKAGAIEWADRCSRSAGGRQLRDIPREELLLIVRALYALYTPEHPAPRDEPPSAGGGGGVLFCSSKAHQEASDVTLNANGSQLQSSRRVRLTDDAGMYADAELTEKLGTLSDGRECVLIGPALGTNSYGILVRTSTPYDDGQDRDSVVYITKDKASDPYDVEPEPEPPAGDTAARDAEWRAWLADAPEPVAGIVSEAEAILDWSARAPDHES